MEAQERRTGVLLALTRIALGWVFLWAFLDKLIGLGFATCRDAASRAVTPLCPKAWLAGGSPTTGFLSGADGALGTLFQALAGQAWVDWLFMLGLLGVGVALLLGAGMRPAAWAGSLMLVLMWLAELPLANNPFMDDHLVYAIVLFLLAALEAGDAYGIGRWWKSTRIAQRFPWLE